MTNRPLPTHIAICDVCGKDKPIVLVCLIGDRLCGECQERQQRISHLELTEETHRAFRECISMERAT
jgi:hypothetical protein